MHWLNVPLKLASISYGITPWSHSRSVLAVAARLDLDSGALSLLAAA